MLANGARRQKEGERDQGPHRQGIGADVEPTWLGQMACGGRDGLGLWAAGKVPEGGVG